MPNELIAHEIEKIASLKLLDEGQRQVLVEGVKYASIPYFPIQADFIEKTILNNVEYPSVEGKLTQAATELKARINRLVDAQFNADKIALEIQELNLDIEDIKASQIQEARMALQIAKKTLEIKQKTWQLRGYVDGCAENFREFTQWKTAVEDCMKVIMEEHPEITDFTQVDFGAVRSMEMEKKIAFWQALADKGEKLTIPQKQLVMAAMMKTTKGDENE